MDADTPYDPRYLAGIVLFNRGDFFEAHEVWESLWMETFYSRLSNSPPSEAARAALRTVRARDEYSHPYYWAAFMVVGR